MKIKNSTWLLSMLLCAAFLSLVACNGGSSGGSSDSSSSDGGGSSSSSGSDREATDCYFDSDDCDTSGLYTCDAEPLYCWSTLSECEQDTDCGGSGSSSSSSSSSGSSGSSGTCTGNIQAGSINGYTCSSGRIYCSGIPSSCSSASSVCCCPSGGSVSCP